MTDHVANAEEWAARTNTAVRTMLFMAREHIAADRAREAPPRDSALLVAQRLDRVDPFGLARRMPGGLHGKRQLRDRSGGERDHVERLDAVQQSLAAPEC